MSYWITEAVSICSVWNPVFNQGPQVMQKDNLSKKMKILLSFTHPHVVPNLYDFLLLWNKKEDILKKISLFFLQKKRETTRDEIFIQFSFLFLYKSVLKSGFLFLISRITRLQVIKCPLKTFYIQNIFIYTTKRVKTCKSIIKMSFSSTLFSFSVLLFCGPHSKKYGSLKVLYMQ